MQDKTKVSQYCAKVQICFEAVDDETAAKWAIEQAKKMSDCHLDICGLLGMTYIITEARPAQPKVVDIGKWKAERAA